MKDKHYNKYLGVVMIVNEEKTGEIAQKKEQFMITERYDDANVHDE